MGDASTWKDDGVLGVLVGFGVIAAVIAVGWLVGRTGVLGPGARYVLARLAFFVLTPSLLLTVLADADIASVFSAPLLVAAAVLVVGAGLFVVIALARRRAAGEVVIGALAAGYVNSSNMGIPVAHYVLGDAALSAPIILMQLAIVTPIVLSVLDRIEQGRVGVRAALLRPLRNPLVIGSVVGLALALTGVRLPDEVMEPFRMLGAATVPVMLLSFGMSLAEPRIPGAGTERVEIVVASTVKLLVMPLTAWALAMLLRLDEAQTFAVVVLAALPTAQNVFTYAQRYRIAESLARDTILITTILAMPVMLVIAALLAPR